MGARLLLWRYAEVVRFPFSAHVRKLSGFLLAVKSGLFQIGVYLDGARGEFVIWWNFHQAVRAAAIVGILKQWCFLIVWL